MPFYFMTFASKTLTIRCTNLQAVEECLSKTSGFPWVVLEIEAQKEDVNAMASVPIKGIPVLSRHQIRAWKEAKYAGKDHLQSLFAERVNSWSSTSESSTFCSKEDGPVGEADEERAAAAMPVPLHERIGRKKPHNHERKHDDKRQSASAGWDNTIANNVDALPNGAKEGPAASPDSGSKLAAIKIEAKAAKVAVTEEEDGKEKDAAIKEPEKNAAAEAAAAAAAAESAADGSAVSTDLHSSDLLSSVLHVGALPDANQGREQVRSEWSSHENMLKTMHGSESKMPSKNNRQTFQPSSTMMAAASAATAGSADSSSASTSNADVIEPTSSVDARQAGVNEEENARNEAMEKARKKAAKRAKRKAAKKAKKNARMEAEEMIPGAPAPEKAAAAAAAEAAAEPAADGSAVSPDLHSSVLQSIESKCPHLKLPCNATVPARSPATPSYEAAENGALPAADGSEGSYVGRVGHRFTLNATSPEPLDIEPELDSDSSLVSVDPNLEIFALEVDPGVRPACQLSVTSSMSCDEILRFACRVYQIPPSANVVLVDSFGKRLVGTNTLDEARINRESPPLRMRIVKRGGGLSDWNSKIRKDFERQIKFLLVDTSKACINFMENLTLHQQSSLFNTFSNVDPDVQYEYSDVFKFAQAFARWLPEKLSLFQGQPSSGVHKEEEANRF